MAQPDISHPADTLGSSTQPSPPRFGHEASEMAHLTPDQHADTPESSVKSPNVQFEFGTSYMARLAPLQPANPTKSLVWLPQTTPECKASDMAHLAPRHLDTTPGSVPQLPKIIFKYKASDMPKPRPPRHPADTPRGFGCRLLKLPPELRNWIFKLVLVKDEPISLNARPGLRVDCDAPTRRLDFLNGPALLRTTASICAEAAPVYYGANIFTGMSELSHLLPRLPHKRQRMVKRLRLCIALDAGVADAGREKKWWLGRYAGFIRNLERIAHGEGNGLVVELRGICEFPLRNDGEDVKWVLLDELAKYKVVDAGWKNRWVRVETPEVSVQQGDEVRTCDLKLDA
ncbi:hypothetical protein LTR22_007918 [Elasticomyces elasticus]|nr:hypothetical protein LTR22_007918 [Elasticomyces elasticus]